jgi:hypothetical protein
MIAAPDLSSASVVLPTTMTIADGGDSGTLVLVAGVFGLIFLFAVVGTVVVNFGIRKK